MQNRPEQLLKACDVYRRLSISNSKFYRIRLRLVANGLKVVSIDGNDKYLESSLDEMIRRAAKNGTPI